jgi:hypothetical protein
MGRAMATPHFPFSNLIFASVTPEAAAQPEKDRTTPAGSERARFDLAASAVQRRLLPPPFSHAQPARLGSSEQDDCDEGGGRDEDEQGGTGGADDAVGGAGVELLAAEVDHASVRGLHARCLRVLARVLAAVKKSKSVTVNHVVET